MAVRKELYITHELSLNSGNQTIHTHAVSKPFTRRAQAQLGPPPPAREGFPHFRLIFGADTKQPWLSALL